MIPLIMNHDETRSIRRIYDIINDTEIPPDSALLSIVVSGETIATTADILPLWLRRQNWFYEQSNLQHYVDIHGNEIDGGYIYAEWRNFIARNGENLRRAIAAMTADYNPIDNYNMIESGSDGEKQDKVTTTPKGKIKVETTPYQTGINSTGDGAKTGKITTETSYENAETETTHSNTLSIIDNDGQSVSGFHTGKQHYFKRSGNVGTTQTQTMIENEILLRKHDILSEFVKRFFDTYCYYVG